MWWTHENSTSVLCCCHISQLVVEERNFLSRRIIYFSQHAGCAILCWRVSSCGSKYVTQNKCVLFQEKYLSVWNKVLTADCLLTLKTPVFTSGSPQSRSGSWHGFCGFVTPVIMDTWSDKQRRWRLQRHETIRQCRHQSYWHCSDQCYADVSLKL